MDGREATKFWCHSCNEFWTATHDRIPKCTTKKLLKESLERASARILSRRHNIGKRRVLEQIHLRSADAKDSVWIANRFSPKWKNILVFDGKYVRVYDELSKNLKEDTGESEINLRNKMVWLCGIDYETGDLPHYDLAEAETRIDLVMYFRALKEIGYPLRVLVSDGNPEISYAARKVFGQNILHQLCTRHFIEGLKRHAGEAKDNLRISNLITLIQRVIEAPNLDESVKYLDELKRTRIRTPLERTLINIFKTHSRELTTHLFYPELNIPHTSNNIENVFRQLNLRLKTIGRFHHWRYARDYLKAWTLLRRFTKFTDCRNGRKWRNGKAPIEIAGVNINGVDCLNL